MMSSLPDPERTLASCPQVIFIVYCLGADAEGRGYAPWLREVDMPFFNSIPGVRHYANWRLSGMLEGASPVWDWFDFQGLSSEDVLEGVWFHPDLDEFRTNWVKLWGYGMTDPPPVLRHAYLMQQVARRERVVPARTGVLATGRGDPPAADSVDLLWRVESTLHKHFTGRDPSRPWRTPSAGFNPLGFDWVCFSHGEAAVPVGATLAARTSLVAAPDQD